MKFWIVNFFRGDYDCIYGAVSRVELRIRMEGFCREALKKRALRDMPNAVSMKNMTMEKRIHKVWKMLVIFLRSTNANYS